MDAFDADALIYAATPDHPLGRRVRALFTMGDEDRTPSPVGLGSVLLLPELLSKPLQDEAADDLEALAALLGRLELRPADRATAGLATALAATYRLRAADAVHLATAVIAGADRFITNNRSDFKKHVAEIAITFPDDLDDPADG